jgi:hypothetical protein
MIIIIGDSHSSSWPKFFSFAAAAVSNNNNRIHSFTKQKTTNFVCTQKVGKPE